MSILASIFLLCCLGWPSLLSSVEGVWTEFDLVRPKNDSWGSDGYISWRKISAVEGNGPTTLGDSSLFGWSIANIGDLDQDGVEDLAVGAPGEDSEYEDDNGIITDVQKRTGSVYILFMDYMGLVKSSTKISGSLGGGPTLYDDEEFGYSVASIGDLDGDGIPDIAVGAPGNLIASVYILYMNRDGTAKSTYLIRGKFKGTYNHVVDGTVDIHEYLPNGPELTYLSRFGLSVSKLGDWDEDGVPDLAVSSIKADGGNGLVYFLYMHRNGTVKSYSSVGTETEIDSTAKQVSVGGAPTFPGRTFVGFGSSILLMPDIDRDGVPEIAIGAKYLDDGDTENYKSGAVFVCFMNRDGTIREYSRISELHEQYNRGERFGKEPEKKKSTFYPGGIIPMVNGDQCGASLTTIGDINMDDRRQHRPWIKSPDAIDLENGVEGADPNRRPIPDLVVGCPQTDTGTLPGRMFFYFLGAAGNMLGFTAIPSEKDLSRGIFPPQGEADHFGQALAAMEDIDNNGIREIAVGAPGVVNEAGAASGAIYVMFFRRRRWHDYWTDTRAYWCAIIIPPSLIVFFICVGIAYFFWKFRRKPDEIEILVLKSGAKITRKRKREKKNRKQEEAKVVIDDAYDF